MPLISAATLTQLRGIAESAMPETARVQGRTSTRGEGGVVSESWTTRTTSPCSLTPAWSAAAGSQEQTLRGAQAWDRGEWTVALPAGTEVRTSDRIIVDGSTKGVAWRKVLNVVGVAGPRSFEARRMVGCVEAEPEPGEVIP